MHTEAEQLRFALFALTPDSHQRLEEGWVNLHLLLWKHTTASLVRVDTEGVTFTPHAVWQGAWRRFERKALAKAELVSAAARRHDSRGEEVPDQSSKSRPMEPIASFTPEGQLIWNSELVLTIKQLCTPPPTGKGGKRRVTHP